MAAFRRTNEDKVLAVVNPTHKANNSGLQVGKRPERKEQNEPNVVSLSGSNSGIQAGINYGDIHGITFNYSENLSMFGSLAEGTHLLDTFMLDVLARRAQIQDRRKPPKQVQDRCCGPYATVKNRKTKLRLLQLAKTFQFLDRGFAEYFQVDVLSFGKQHAQRLLNEARKSISKMQKRQNDPASADVGDLGLFCEQIARTWGEPDTRKPKFVVTQRRDEEIMYYLQDALEIPYWEFMIDIFLGWKANSNSLSGEVVLRVLHSAKIDLLDERRRLLDDMASLRKQDAEDIAPIIGGIDARIEVLESL